MKKYVLGLLLSGIIIFASIYSSFAQVVAADVINKNTSIFDKIVTTPDTTKARISAINIDILNEKVSVIYQLGDVVDSSFVVKNDLLYTFSSEDGKTEFSDILASIKIDLNSLIDILKSKIK